MDGTERRLIDRAFDAACTRLYRQHPDAFRVLPQQWAGQRWRAVAPGAMDQARRMHQAGEASAYSLYREAVRAAYLMLARATIEYQRAGQAAGGAA